MAQCTRPTCAWCGLEGHYGFDRLPYAARRRGEIRQVLVNGGQVFLHLCCDFAYRHANPPSDADVVQP